MKKDVSAAGKYVGRSKDVVFVAETMCVADFGSQHNISFKFY
jgi:hypothetical protein